MSTLTETLVLNGLKPRHAEHIAAVVAEWLESDEVVGVVTPHARNSVGGCICGERGVREPFSRHIATALAAHAKGEADE